MWKICGNPGVGAAGGMPLSSPDWETSAVFGVNLEGSGQSSSIFNVVLEFVNRFRYLSDPPSPPPPPTPQPQVPLTFTSPRPPITLHRSCNVYNMSFWCSGSHVQQTQWCKKKSPLDVYAMISFSMDTFSPKTFYVWNLKMFKNKKKVS